LNHFGHCVTELDRAVRFYTELFGFEVQRRMEVPDRPADRLLRLEAPLGMTAVYLAKEGVVLELLHFDRPGNPPARARPVNEPGLTHMSFCVDDVEATAARAVSLGGQALPETDIGAAMFIRDPDGQLIELLPMSYRSGSSRP
jgi:catechol 2,3-dioxygenase-like lactoylglutathione lyase family enzyme